MPTAVGQQARQRRGFRGDVEGLRAVAILLVVAYHARLGHVPGGYVGVDVFFVISGYLITTLLWTEISQSGRVSFGRFYARRARRLLPASMLVLAVTLVVSRLVLSPLTMPSVAKDALATTLYGVNYRFAATHANYLTVASVSPFQHYWSLAVEEQFYLAWPLLLLAGSLGWRGSARASARRTFVCVGAVACASFVASLALTRGSPTWAFFSLPTRAWELATGALLAFAAPVFRRLSRPAAALVGWAGLVAIGAAAVRFAATTPYPGTAALVPVVGAAAVLASGEGTRRAGPRMLLRCRPLQRIGRVSYSWYLWHWPVLVLAAAWAGRALRAPERLGLVMASLALAELTRVLVEDPMRFAPNLVRRPPRALLGGLALTSIAAAASVALIVDVPALHGRHARAAALPALTGQVSARRTAGATHRSGGRPRPEQSRLAASMSSASAAISQALATAPVPSNLEPGLRSAHGDKATPFVDGCFDDFADTAVRQCTYGATGGRGVVVLFGDSHATHWYPNLQPVALAHGWRLVVLTKATCPPLRAEVWSPTFGREYRECDAWRAAAIRRIATDRPILVILGMNRNYGPVYHLQEYGPAWLRGLEDTVRTIRGAGAQVMVLGPEPLQAGDVPACLVEHLDNEAACARPVRDAFDGRGIAAERRSVTSSGGHYVDVTSWFCVPAGCPVVVGNLLVYRDQNHITTSYATWLAPLMSARIDLLLAGPSERARPVRP